MENREKNGKGGALRGYLGYTNELWAKAETSGDRSYRIKVGAA